MHALLMDATKAARTYPRKAAKPLASPWWATQPKQTPYALSVVLLLYDYGIDLGLKSNQFQVFFTQIANPGPLIKTMI